jgi:hypothetical protein
MLLGIWPSRYLTLVYEVSICLTCSSYIEVTYSHKQDAHACLVLCAGEVEIFFQLIETC